MQAGRRGQTSSIQSRNEAPPPWRQRQPEMVEEYVGPYIVDINPREAMAPPRIAVFTDYDITEEVQRASIMVRTRPDIRQLRGMVAGLLDLERDSLEFTQPMRYGAVQGEPLPEWMPTPFIVLVNGGARRAERVPTVALRSPRGQRWMLPCDYDESHGDFLRRVESVVGRPADQIMLHFRNGEPWLFPRDAEEADDVAITYHRGGMMQQPSSSMGQSVSTTEPFEEDNIQQPMEQEPEQESVQGEEQGRSQSSSSEVEPVYRDHIEHGQPTMWVWVYPRDPPSAQPNLVKRRLMYGPERIADIWAPGATIAGEVLDEVEQRIHPHAPITPEPYEAQTWGMILQAKMPDKVESQCDDQWDLRKGAYEPFQSARVIPLLHKDIVTARFIVPRRLTPMQAQDRISAAADNTELWQLHVLGHQWVVIAMPLPARLKHGLRDLHLFEESGKTHMPKYPRAGVRRQAAAAPHEPRAAIQAWAVQKAREVVPEADTRTLSTILKAEYKTASAILHCNSEAQARHAILAAYRRSGLPEPAELAAALEGHQQHAQAEVTNEWLANMMVTMTQQTVIMTQLHELQAANATSQETQKMGEVMKTAISQQQAQIAGMQQAISQLANRLGGWETNPPPGVPSRPPHGAPETPRSSASVGSSPHKQPERGYASSKRQSLATEPYDSPQMAESEEQCRAESPEKPTLPTEGNQQQQQPEENEEEAVAQIEDGDQDAQPRRNENQQEVIGDEQMPQLLQAFKSKSEASEQRRMGVRALAPFKAK